MRTAISFAVGRIRGSIFQQSEINLAACSGIQSGISGCPCPSNFFHLRSDSFLQSMSENGCSRENKTHIIMPKLYISAACVYDLPLSTSGAIYGSTPKTESSVLASWLACLHSPRSLMYALYLFLSSRMLPG